MPCSSWWGRSQGLSSQSSSGTCLPRLSKRRGKSVYALPQAFEERIRAGERFVLQLLEGPVFPFDSTLRGRLPDEQGLYRIFELDGDPVKTLRSGRTKRAARGLRQRVYQNHFMGEEDGNIRRQLVRSGRWRETQAAKDFLRARCGVHVLMIADEEERKWAE